MFIQRYRKNFRHPPRQKWWAIVQGRRGRVSAGIGWLAVAAVLLQILVPLVHHPALALNMDAMPHCAMSGDRENVPANDSGKAPASKTPFCPICLSLYLLGGGFVAPEPPVFVTVFDDHQVFHLSRISFIQRRLFNTGQPRAPPVFA